MPYCHKPGQMGKVPGRVSSVKKPYAKYAHHKKTDDLLWQSLTGEQLKDKEDITEVQFCGKIIYLFP